MSRVAAPSLDAEAARHLAATPAGRGLRWLIESLADPSALTVEAAAGRLAPSVTRTLPVAEYVAALAGLARQIGPLAVERVDLPSPTEAAARLLSGDGQAWLLRCAVEESPPHLLVATQVSPARVPTDAGCGAPVPWPEIADAAPSGGPVSGALGTAPEGGADPAPAPDAAPDLTPELVALRAESRLPALLAGVLVGGRLVRWTTLGYAEVATRRRPTRRTALRLTSLTTVLTALAAHRLVAAGRLGLDDPVADHLARPLLRTPSGAPVRVRHLLGHTSGLAGDAGLPAGVPAGQPVPALAELLGPSLPVAAEPGTSFGHSPLGYALLGEVVAAAAGRGLAAHLAEDVLDPLGLRRTSLGLDERVARQPLCGYEVDFDEVVVAAAAEPLLPAAAGGVSTLDDLAALAALLLRPEHRPLVSPAVATGVPGVAGTLGGLLATEDGGAAVAWHCGGWPGAVTGCWLAPERGVGLVLAGNAFAPSRLARLDAAGRELLAVLLDRLDA